MSVYINWKRFSKIIRAEMDRRGIKNVEEAAQIIGIGRARLYEILGGMVDSYMRKSTLDKLLDFCHLKESDIPLTTGHIKEVSVTMNEIIDILKEYDHDNLERVLAQLRAEESLRHKKN